ncbi:DNA/RNA nuclease SfsA [Halopseudomonas nanhaiensis]|uniref:DNA/RNA nuclease SfsA n=1 Tax=Halopseudomonas nanhaiensis TaxID=2830842 RepID=UPI001CBD5434|nr:DNA/RNA nuclease SfsA [Halopseudomonas nanhaiensis]UAX00100.1 DNA/RNA nuclease SfsA [Halopseudomonas nanhaiensis]
MPFDVPLERGTLVRRYKRFFADVVLDDGREVTVHCPNTGSMLRCGEPGSPVWVALQDRPGRKLPGTWELVQTPDGALACVHSARANKVVAASLRAGLITPLSGYASQRAEVCLSPGKSRFDFLLSDPGECVVEVKSVTLGLGAGQGAFPDAVSTRGQKHLLELIEVAAAGRRACMLFCVMHSGIAEVAPADHIDPVYGRVLRQAAANGVEVIAWSVWPTPAGLQVRGQLPVAL